MTIITVWPADRDGQQLNFISVNMEQHPFIFSSARTWRIRRHLAFWTFWWVFQGFLYSFIGPGANVSWWLRLQLSLIESAVYLTAHIFLAYSLMYFVLPRYLLQQRYWLTAAWTLLLFFLTAVISVTVGSLVIDRLRENLFGGIFFFGVRTISQNIFFSLLAGLRGAITIGGIAAAIKLMKYWYVKEQRNLQLQKENVESQLQLLKAQVHPHFLFNTLNNIYSFTQDASPTAARMVTRLSDLLRYMLYEGSESLVPLGKELKMVQDYISLEKMRYGNKLELHTDLPGDTEGLYIAPLLLLPLVENCFKHGTSQVLENPWMNLHVSVTGKEMQVKLINGKIADTMKTHPRTGIGISNVQKRLGLLYPGKHELTITNEEDVFIVNLKLELDQKRSLLYNPEQKPVLQNA